MSGEDRQAFALILGLLDVKCKTPIEIIPYHLLRRPREDDIPRIRECIHRYSMLGELNVLSLESTWDQDGVACQRSDRSSDWRYWTIETDGNYNGVSNEGWLDIEEASRLTNVEIECGLTFYSPAGGGLMWQMGADPFRKLKLSSPVAVLDEGGIRTIRWVYDAIASLDARYTQIRKAIRRYRQLAAIAEGESLYVLGAFGVVESLLTHDPHGGYDSLGHQIKTKMALLNSRFDCPLDSAAPGGTSLDTLWSKLYHYRSCIAHGGTPDFGGSLQVLGSPKVARRFLDCAAKTLLRHALREPQLITDLRAC